MQQQVERIMNRMQDSNHSQSNSELTDHLLSGDNKQRHDKKHFNGNGNNQQRRFNNNRNGGNGKYQKSNGRQGGNNRERQRDNNAPIAESEKKANS